MTSAPLAAALLLVAAPLAQAAPVPDTTAGWLARMGDFSENTLPARAPENFVGFLHAATEPAFHQARFSNLSEPAWWNTATHTMASPGVVGNLGAVANPQTAMAWMQAMMDPRFYAAVATVLGDPAKWARWSMASTAPESYQPFAKPFDPALQARWQAQMQAPAAWPMAAPGAAAPQ